MRTLIGLSVPVFVAPHEAWAETTTLSSFHCQRCTAMGDTMESGGGVEGKPYISNVVGRMMIANWSCITASSGRSN